MTAEANRRVNATLPTLTRMTRPESTRPVVSFVMPVWKPRDDWLRAAVQSVLDEDVDLELIVVDDGNIEPIAPLLGEFAADARVRVVRVGHGGIAHARNAGLAEAVGAYVRFVDADDEVVRGGTALLLRAAAGRRCIAHGAIELCDEQLRVDEVRRSRDRGSAWRACLTGGFTVYHSALLFPSDVLEAVGGWRDRQPCEDWDLVLRTLEIVPVEPCHGVVYRYRRWPGSMSKVTEIARKAGESVVREHFDRYPEHRGTRIERRAEAYLTQRALHRFSDNALWPSRTWWRAAIENPAYPAQLVALGARRKVNRLRRRAAHVWRRPSSSHPGNPT